jgi:hypothetical protein
MINRVVLLAFGVLLVFGVFGCSSEVFVEPVEPGVPICLQSASQADLMAICEDVLVRMHFEIEKYDVEKGYVKTWPLRGAQFFEFWRSDNAGKDNGVISNLHSALRTVELQITGSQGQFCVECKSRLRRLSIPESELTSTGVSAGIFTGGSTRFQKLRPVSDDLDWIEMGSDTALEQRILGRILGKSEVKE